MRNYRITIEREDVKALPPPSLWMPPMHCSSCHAYPSGVTYPIPEVALLPEWHPVLREITAISDRINDTRCKLTDQLMAMDLNHLSPAEEARLHDIQMNDGTVTPEVFNKLAGALRRSLGISPSRRIAPGSPLGIVLPDLTNIPLDDFAVIDSLIVVSRQAVEVLTTAGLAGWEAYRVDGQSGASERAVLVVVGEAGAPPGFTLGTDYDECPRCGVITYANPFREMPRDVPAEEGFFRFAWCSDIHATAMCRETIEDAHLTGISFGV